MSADPLNGLRGLSELHVCLFHFLIRSTAGINLYGGSEIPVFFLLSGYCLTLGYGAKKQVDWGAFLRNRFARLAPMYILTNGIFFTPLPQYLGAGYGDNGESLATKVKIFTCTTTWFLPWTTVFPPNGPSWTVSTLFFFYLVYPLLLPRLQRLSSLRISQWIVLLHWLQCLPFLLASRLGYDYWVITAFPIFRLPVFIMGILGGLQTLRWRNSEGFKDPVENRIFLHDIFPWWISGNTTEENSGCEAPEYVGGADSSGSTIVYSINHKDQAEDVLTDLDESKTIWGRRTDINIILFVSLHIFLAIASLPPQYQYQYQVDFQLVLVHLQLSIISGVSRAPAQSSLLSRLCSSSPLQFLGDLSMCLYLVHGAVLLCVDFVRLGQNFRDLSILSWLDIVKLFPLTTLLAWVLHVVVEEPMRRQLQTNRQPINQQQQDGGTNGKMITGEQTTYQPAATRLRNQ